MKPLTQDMIDFIRSGTETRRWEFKPPMAWSNRQRKRKSELTRTALALSNISGGGYVVIGISQKRDRRNGIVFDRKGLQTYQFRSFDNPDDIGRFFNERSSQRIKFEIFGGEIQLDTTDKKFIVIQIFELKSFIPMFCTKEFRPREPYARLVKYAIYIRSISDPVESKIISSQEEWEELILRLLKYKEEILYKDLMSICHIIHRGKKLSKKKIGRKEAVGYTKVLKRDKF